MVSPARSRLPIDNPDSWHSKPFFNFLFLLFWWRLTILAKKWANDAAVNENGVLPVTPTRRWPQNPKKASDRPATTPIHRRAAAIATAPPRATTAASARSGTAARWRNQRSRRSAPSRSRRRRNPRKSYRSSVPSGTARNGAVLVARMWSSVATVTVAPRRGRGNESETETETATGIGTDTTAVVGIGTENGNGSGVRSGVRAATNAGIGIERGGTGTGIVSGDHPTDGQPGEHYNPNAFI